MKWARVKGMKLKPNCCVACGSTGEMTEEGPPDAYFAEAVDINWGDSLYLCESCVRVLGELAGMASEYDYTRLKNKAEKMKKEVGQLTKERDELQNKIHRMVDGARARKEAKEAVNA